jgi:hypothetical protein
MSVLRLCFNWQDEDVEENPFQDGEGVAEAGEADDDRPHLHGARARTVTLEISLASIVLAGR